MGHDVRRHIGQLDFLQLWRFVSLESFVGKQLSESTMYEIFPKQDAYIPANIRIHTRAHLHVFFTEKAAIYCFVCLCGEDLFVYAVV